MGKNYSKKSTKDEMKDVDSKSKVDKLRGKKSYSTRKVSRDSERNGYATVGKGPLNDPSFYGSNPTLAQNVGTLWFNNPTGLIDSTKLGEQVIGRLANPNVCAIDVCPTFGYWGTSYLKNLVDNNDSMSYSMNYVAHILKWLLSRKSGRSTVYESSDLIRLYMQYYSAVFQIWEARRAYGFLKVYMFKNPLLAENILTASGMDYRDSGST